MFANSVSMSVNFLKVTGGLPFNNINKRLYYLYSSFIVIVFVMPVAILPYVDIILKQESDVAQIAKRSFISSEALILAVKMWLLLVKHESVVEIINYHDMRINKKIMSISGDMLKMLKTSSFYGKAYLIFVQVAVVGIAFRPLLQGPEKLLAFEMWFPYNYQENNFVYLCTLLYMYLGMYSVFKLFCHIECGMSSVNTP